MKNRYWIIVFIILIIALFITAIGAFKEGTKCVGNPLVYGVDKAIKASNSDVVCQCHFTDPKYNSIIVTKNGIRQDTILQP